MSLLGFRAIDPAAPVTHVSYYEADAFARWAGYRLPSEFEWEVAAAAAPLEGRTLGHGHLRPMPATPGQGLQQMFGDVWEWTGSAYLPYPGFKAAAGAVGEYNGKFMCSQFVLRGGSCVTPEGHVPRTYRNFFYPHQRWQFTGLRLATDA
jgi:ergothioneine biosynthesis protein EgtB